MMSISRKLGRLGSAGPGSKPSFASASSPVPANVLASETHEADESEDSRWDAFRSALRAKAVREEKRTAAPAQAPMELPCTTETTAHGPLHRFLKVDSIDGDYCGVPHRALTGLDPQAMARFALDESFTDVDPMRLVFLDTETTGLAGGAGTVPFLVGVAYANDGGMHTEQWLLRRFGEEAPILHRLAEVLENASALVTYNGKSFDWPLLRARYVLARIPLPRIARHLDLVHGARRLLRSRLPTVRLMDVEREMLGFVRSGDIDAAAIPEIFLHFQRTGVHPEMPRIIEHHALDLRSMPAILVRFCAWMSAEVVPQHLDDRLACAQVAARSGHDDSARKLVSTMLEAAPDELAAVGALLEARQARRALDLDGERASLERAVGAARDDDVRHHAWLELSKFSEHRAKDLVAALVAARAALAILDDDANARRVERLDRRLARAALPKARRRPMPGV